MRVNDTDCKPKRPAGKIKGAAVWVCTERAVPKGKHCAKTKTKVMSRKALLEFLLEASSDGETQTIHYGMCEQLPKPKTKRVRRKK